MSLELVQYSYSIPKAELWCLSINNLIIRLNDRVYGCNFAWNHIQVSISLIRVRKRMWHHWLLFLSVYRGNKRSRLTLLRDLAVMWIWYTYSALINTLYMGSVVRKTKTKAPPGHLLDSSGLSALSPVSPLSSVSSTCFPSAAGWRRRRGAAGRYRDSE